LRETLSDNHDHGTAEQRKKRTQNIIKDLAEK